MHLTVLYSKGYCVFTIVDIWYHWFLTMSVSAQGNVFQSLNMYFVNNKCREAQFAVYLPSTRIKKKSTCNGLINSRAAVKCDDALKNLHKPPDETAGMRLVRGMLLITQMLL